MPRGDTLSDRLRLLLTAVVLTLAGYLVLCGFLLLFEPNGGGDLQNQWIAEQYVLRGTNPFDVYARYRAERDGLPTPATVLIDPVLGVPQPNYPPWTYFTELGYLTPTEFAAAKVCYAALNVLLFGFLALWLVRGSGLSRQAVPFALGATFAADSVLTTLAYGQLGVIVVAFLLAAYWFDRRGQFVMAGLMLGIALIKPTLSGTFVLAFLVQRRWGTVAVTVAYTAVGSAVVWAMTGTDPLTMLRQMEVSGREWGITNYTGRNDAVAMLAGFGLEPRLALRLAVPISVVLTLALMLTFRRAPLMTHFAIAAMAARLWVDHYHYDDVILLFVMFALILELKRAYSRRLAVAFVLLGVTLWIPQSAASGFLGVNPLWGNVWFDRGFLVCQAACVGALLARPVPTLRESPAPS